MVHQLHLVVADLLSGGVKALHVGCDMAEANEVFEKAGPENEAVRIFDFPAATRLRYPAQEKIDIQVRLEATNRNANTVLSVKRAELLKASDLAKEHGQKALALQTEIDALEGKGPEKAPAEISQKQTKGTKKK